LYSYNVTHDVFVHTWLEAKHNIVWSKTKVLTLSVAYLNALRLFALRPHCWHWVLFKYQLRSQTLIEAVSLVLYLVYHHFMLCTNWVLDSVFQR